MIDSPQKARRLGRGLSSLIDVVTPVPVDVPATPLAGGAAAGNGAMSGLQQVPVDRITPNPHQPRESFSEDAIARLADSITRSGLMQPIIVRPSPTGGYQLVAGERR